MSQRCKYLGLDVAVYLGFGYDLNIQTSNVHRYLVHAMTVDSWRMNLYMQWLPLRKLRMEMFFYLFAVIRGRSLLQTASKIIRARLSQSRHAKNDMYSYMAETLDSPEGNEKITLSTIRNEAIFFPAGGDTIGMALSALFFYLAYNPSYRQKLAEEVRSTFSSASDIRGGVQLSRCVYLRAYINEAIPRIR
ncbi:cytochrome P450 [Xylaria telfairii]|nr:cytochrome P450 [Xylaria telfairii]